MTHATSLARLAAGALFATLSLQAGAAELGTFGDTWDIREHDLITVLKKNLEQHFAGKTQEQIQQEMQKKAEDEAMRPPPVEGLTTGRETHRRLFDPSFTVQRDIADQNGVVFAHKGQKVNPFDVIPVFDETLYFIDADDDRQIAWMKQQVPHTTTSRVILVNGNVRDSAEALGSRVYFDQTGSITKKFGITQVPAEVKQAPGQKLFLITEFGLPDR
ncbi:type-F conjugative transfer system protein TraW [Pantoea sp. LMR881]|uniref:type-F conjugative transfer system protein TraW n=1 Tax=Enterobacterales TaxID=91347 RepID=UPI0022B0421A|nr:MULTISPECIES: type-F conjugative transfer system protein TraW [Enterobacterales]MCZ4060991.1 type-F conjugative transfer system protein TraW [Pantoea sp. LMR881]MEC4256296.1 type-F conjugative transfer system protein TraW [Escherichia coli]